MGKARQWRYALVGAACVGLMGITGAEEEQAAKPAAEEKTVDLDVSVNDSNEFGFIGTGEATGVLAEAYPLYSRLQLGSNYQDLLLRAGLPLFGQQGLVTLTARGLKSRREYNFGVSKDEVWTSETSFGLDVNGKLLGMTFGGYAGANNAPGKDLGSLRQVQETPDAYLEYLVPRRLTGSRDYSAGLLLSGVINPMLRTRMSAGAQRIETDLLQGKSTKTEMTGSFALDVMLNKGTQMNLFAGTGPDAYNGGVRFYFPLDKTLLLSTQCNGQRQKGYDSLFYCGIGLQYRFGGQQIQTSFEANNPDGFNQQELKTLVRWLPAYADHIGTAPQVDASAKPVLVKVTSKRPTPTPTPTPASGPTPIPTPQPTAVPTPVTTPLPTLVPGTPPLIAQIPTIHYSASTFPFQANLASFITPTNGDPILGYFLTGTLPANLTFNPATGVLSGVSFASQSQTMTFWATDKDGSSNAVSFLLAP
ncbi:hypothetical protein IGB42_02783 [Andreprevotia sp. IGB-42]|uniref:Ig domain-containing protein n=1 Tax=Andreprevotia sp. IGB-42 TaxID=2497473 RepID=UPI001357957B|nr:Ig domain-containing protein [Andreprevotia sp. IGB-42]KAF0812934.1 hypothetical protein IGB42_02783 [Andreprevotia sp. IGB-42]